MPKNCLSLSQKNTTCHLVKPISTHGHKVVYLRMCVIVSNTNKRESLKIAAICKRMLNHFRPGPAPFIRGRGRLTSARVPGLITRVS